MKLVWEIVRVAGIVVLAVYFVVGVANYFQNRYILHKPPIARATLKPFIYSRYANQKNAWWHYAVAGSKISEGEDELVSTYQNQEGLRQSGEPIPPAEKVVSRADYLLALRKLEPVVAEVKLGTLCQPEDYQPPRKRESIAETFPEFTRVRKLARIAVYSGQAAVEEGRVREGLEDFLAAIKMGNDVGRETILIGALIGYAIQAIGRSELPKTLENPGLTPQDARFVVQELGTVIERRLPFRTVLIDEYFLSRGALAEVLAKGEIPNPEFHSFWWTVYTNIPGVKAMTFRNYDRLWARMMAYADKPYAEARKIDTPLEEIPGYDLFNRILSPASLARLQTRDLSLYTLLAGTRLMYALEAYRLEKGLYPSSLGDLVKVGIIESIPEDRFDGKPLRYRQLEGGKNYLLYSVGPDMKDDGGKKAYLPDLLVGKVTGDMVFQKGFDIYDQRLAKRG